MSTPEDRALAARELPQETLLAPFGSTQAFEVAQRMANALKSSTMVPQEYQNNMGNCLIAMELAARTQSSILAIMQNIYIVHGRPGWSGKFCIAALNASGLFSEPVHYEFKGAEGNDDWGCRAVGITKSGREVKGPWVDIKMAKAEGWYGRNGSKWKTMPELMMRYRSSSFLINTEAPGLLMGMPTADEIMDMRPAKEVGPREPVTINDLMTSQGQAGTGAAPPIDDQEPDKRQPQPADDPEEPKEPEWPKPGPTRDTWVDSDGVIWNPDAHASFRGPRPSVNDDGTFRAKRGYTHKAKALAEEARSRRENPQPPAGDGEGEPGDSGAAGPRQDDAGAGDQAADGEADETLAKAEELTRQAIAIIERCQTVDQLNEQEEVALDMVRGTVGVKAVEDAAVRKYRALSTVPE